MNMTPEQERDALIDRYINHKLTAEEEAEFEIRMMDDSELFEQVQIRSALKTGLNQQRDRLLKPQVLQGSHKILPFRLWVQQPMSMAASFLIAALCIYMLVSTRNGASSDGLARIETVLLLEQTRGDVLQAFSGRPPYLFQIDVGLGNEGVPFNLTLIDASGEEITTQSGIAADGDGWIRLVADEPLSGEYIVVIQSELEAGSEQTREYRLQLSD